MKTWVLPLLGCMLVATSHAQSSSRVIYQWTDANGVTHFSDQPQPGARKIVLNGAPPSSAAAATVPSTPSTRAQAAPTTQYSLLEIWSPANETSFFEPDTEITVRLRSEPALDAADRLVTYVDGRQLPDINATEHRLTNMPRGAHTITSVIYGRDGAEKIRSAPVVFFMKQPTVPQQRATPLPARPKPR
jgi:hypothetical protein